MNTSIKKIITYIATLVLTSSIGYALVLNAKNWQINPFISMFILMWCPAISAFITQLIYQRNLRGFGWKLGKLQWLITAYTLPLLCGGIAYGFIWITGIGTINPDYKFSIFHLVMLGTLFNLAFAAGEEIGWRGFLVPELFKLTSFTKTCFISGLIWALWHFPIIMGGAYLSDIPLGIELVLFIIIVTSMTFIANWLRLISGSVWVSVLLHASHNLYLQRLFQPMTILKTPASKYIAGESGIALLTLYALIGLACWLRRSSLAKV